MIADIHVSHNISNGDSATTATFSMPNVDNREEIVIDESPPSRRKKRKPIKKERVIGPVIILGDSPEKNDESEMQQGQSVEVRLSKIISDLI